MDRKEPARLRFIRQVNFRVGSDNYVVWKVTNYSRRMEPSKNRGTNQTSVAGDEDFFPNVYHTSIPFRPYLIKIPDLSP